jgi:hypothetical protein
MRKLAIMLSASALLLGLAAASAIAQTQTSPSQLKALILNANPVVKEANCRGESRPDGCQAPKYMLCKGEGKDRICSCKCCC